MNEYEAIAMRALEVVLGSDSRLFEGQFYNDVIEQMLQIKFSFFAEDEDEAFWILDRAVGSLFVNSGILWIGDVTLTDQSSNTWTASLTVEHVLCGA